VVVADEVMRSIGGPRPDTHPTGSGRLCRYGMWMVHARRMRRGRLRGIGV
jgi:hypothetical protein